MARLLKSLALLLLLMAGQQGAIVHDLSHLACGAQGNSLDALKQDGAPCVLCPVFAQASAPTFSHSFKIPTLFRTAAQRTSPAPRELVETSAPRPRSRGPPV
jgi:hypothetical protein